MNNFIETIKLEFIPAKNKNNPLNRLLYIDILKILAAFLTVFYHLAYYKLDYGFVQGQVYTPNINRIVMCLSACCVPLFFLVNGALLLKAERSIRSVYIKIIKIALLLLIWSWSGFPSWFFKTLCILYLLFPIFRWIIKNKRLHYTACIVVFLFPFLYNFAVFLVAFFGVTDFLLFGIKIPISILERTGVFTMYGVLYFLLGPILKNAKRTPLVIDASLIIGGLALVVWECVGYTNVQNQMFDGVNAAFPTVGALFLSVGLFLLIKKGSYNKIVKIISLLSSGVLAIYLTHSLFIKWFYMVVGNELKISLILSLAITLLICVIAAAIGKIASRIPILCWFFKI